MYISSDLTDLLREFVAYGVRFLIVGAHAVSFYSRPRNTSDFDIWVDSQHENAERVYKALAAFGAPLDNLTVEDLMSDDTVFQIGVGDNRIDILTGLTGLTFEAAWPRRTPEKVEGIDAAFIGKDDLIANKRATGRHRDLGDVEMLLSDAQD